MEKNRNRLEVQQKLNLFNLIRVRRKVYHKNLD